MSDRPIDFTSVLLKREQEKHLRERKHCLHADGEAWFAYCYEYDFLGKKFGIELWARNKDEALAACEGVRQSLRYAGEVYMEIPAGE